MGNTYICVTALALLSATASSFAAPGFEPGIYAEVVSGKTSVTSKYTANGDDISLGAALGYQYSANLGFEVYSRTLSFIPFPALAAAPGYYPDQHSGIAAIGTLPLNDIFSLQGRVGVGQTTMQPNRAALSDRTDTDAVIGIGVRYALTHHFSLNLEATRLSKSEVSIYSIGARYQF